MIFNISCNFMIKIDFIQNNDEYKLFLDIVKMATS